MGSGDLDGEGTVRKRMRSRRRGMSQA